MYYEYNNWVLNLFNSPQLDFLDCTKYDHAIVSIENQGSSVEVFFIRRHKQRGYLVARDTFSAEMLSQRGVRHDYVTSHLTVQLMR